MLDAQAYTWFAKLVAYGELLFTLAILLILSWKVSGYIGADYYLLRWLGTPWHGVPTTAKPQPKPVAATQ